MKTPFSPRLIEEVQAAVEHHEQAILFQNRRGYSPVLECHSCGWTPKCTKCDVSLTYHQKQNRLICHYCGTVYGIPPKCPNCGDTELRDVGYGTEKLKKLPKTFSLLPTLNAWTWIRRVRGQHMRKLLPVFNEVIPMC